MIINSVLFVPFGLMMLTVPGILFPMFGIVLDADGILMARVFGSALMSIGLMCYLAWLFCVLHPVLALAFLFYLRKSIIVPALQ